MDLGTLIRSRLILCYSEQGHAISLLVVYLHLMFFGQEKDTRH